MAKTIEKGDLAVAIISADLMKRGYKLAKPLSEDLPFDLILIRHNKLERIQCKYTEAKNNVISVLCRSNNAWISYKYTPDQIDWIAVYDKITDNCYYVPSSLLGINGRHSVWLRINPTKNKQVSKIKFAKDYTNI